MYELIFKGRATRGEKDVSLEFEEALLPKINRLRQEVAHIAENHYGRDLHDIIVERVLENGLEGQVTVA